MKEKPEKVVVRLNELRAPYVMHSESFHRACHGGGWEWS